MRRVEKTARLRFMQIFGEKTEIFWQILASRSYTQKL